MSGMTFQQYLDGRIAEDVEDDPDVDADVLRREFLEAIEEYGFAGDDVIPGTFIETLRKHIL